MSANQTAGQPSCGCPPEETQWCLRWMQDHGDPSGWDQAAEAAYKKAHDEFLAVAQ
jgi:hypothetical protein